MKKYYEILDSHTIKTLQELVEVTNGTMGKDAIRRLQFLCYEKANCLNVKAVVFSENIAGVKSLVDKFKALSSPDRQNIAIRVESFYTAHLRETIRALEKWIVELQGMDIDRQQLKKRLPFSDHFNPDARFANKSEKEKPILLEEKFIRALSGIDKILFSASEKSKKPKSKLTFLRHDLFSELYRFYKDELVLDSTQTKNGPFFSFLDTIITDSNMAAFDIVPDTPTGTPRSVIDKARVSALESEIKEAAKTYKKIHEI